MSLDEIELQKKKLLTSHFGALLGVERKGVYLLKFETLIKQTSYLMTTSTESTVHEVLELTGCSSRQTLSFTSVKWAVHSVAGVSWADDSLGRAANGHNDQNDQKKGTHDCLFWRGFWV